MSILQQKAREQEQTGNNRKVNSKYNENFLQFCFRSVFGDLVFVFEEKSKVVDRLLLFGVDPPPLLP